jgi:hypothetical protein
MPWNTMMLFGTFIAVPLIIVIIVLAIYKGGKKKKKISN